MTSTSKTLIVGAMACLCASSFGQGMAYGVDAQSKLWLLDLADASSTLIGDVGITATGLGMDGSGRLFATRSNGLLYRISTVDASSTFIGAMGIGLSASMDWDAANSRMLVANDSATPSIYSVDLSTGGTTLVVAGTSSAAQLQTMAVRTGSSIMDVRHNSGIPGEGGDKHGSFDYSTGTFSTLPGVFTEVLGIDYGSDGALYGLSRIGRLIKIDPTDGSEIDIGLVNGGVGFLGMASVPEPGTMAVIGLGVAALLRRRSKR